MSFKSSGQKRRRSIGQSARLGIEPLEQRLLLSTVSWIGGSGSWTTGTDWSSGSVPTSANVVVINQPGNIQVTLTGSASVGSLSVTGDTLVVSNGTLSISTNSSFNAGSSLQLNTATLTTQAGATLTNSGAISVSAGGDLNVGGAFNQTTSGVLTLASGALSSGIGTNLLGNSDFEAPVGAGSDPNGWGNWGSSITNTTYAFSGAQSLVESGSNSGVNQSFSVTPGTSYTVSVYTMIPAKLTGDEVGVLNLLFDNSSGTQLSGSVGNQVLSSSSAVGGPVAGAKGGVGWNLITMTAIAPATAATITVALQAGAYNGPGSGSIYWDDAQFGPTAHSDALASAAGVFNSGTISLGVGDVLNDTGTFSQSSTGTLSTLLGGPAAGLLFGSVSSTGAATLGGKLIATLANGYTPSINDGFTLITYSGETGTFSTYQLPSGATYTFQPGVGPMETGIGAVPLTVSTTANIGTVIAAAPPGVVGVNLAYWDNQLTTTQTEQMVEAAGLNMFRFPGGSSSDDYHFNIAANYGDGSANTIPEFAEFIQAVGGTGLVTTDYGSGSPQEAEAELAYLVGSPTDTTVIGTGIEWNDSTGQWQNVNWQTVGYWASVRAASPLGTDDGLNFLRIDHAAPFSNITYWEIGNEEYGSWEIDHHGTAGPGGVSTGAQHDPETYAKFADAFATFVAADQANLPKIHIGIDSGDPTGNSDGNWTRNVLADGEALGFVPGFISDHSYMQGPGSESDSFLLNDTVSDAASTLDWSTRYSDYESMLAATVGSSASSVLVMATEYNSNYGVEGKQMVSIVNGLFVADSIGSLMNSGYSAGIFWDLRNGWTTSGNNSPTLYGWRQGGDEGILGDPGNTTDAPSTGPYVPYPNYFAEELASKIVQSGGKVVSAVTSYNEMSVYTVLEPNGHLDLMVINKNPDAGITDQFNLTGFNPSGQAQIWQYGEVQDFAQSLTTNGAASLLSLSTNLNFTGGSFSYTFPQYSMTVIDLTPTPVVVNAAAANPGAVTGTTTALSALGSENGSNSGLNYTWSATGPAGVSYTGATNGTGAANNITAVFSAAGNYNFKVTITDAGGTSTTSSVGVTVQQTPAGVTVSPSNITVATGSMTPFSASATDQFGGPINSPAFSWSITGAGNSISAAGVATLGSTPGAYVVSAKLGSASNTANVTAAVAPVVSTFQVNDGSVQRSMVDSLTVTFNEAVSLNASAISLNMLSQSGGASTPMAFILTPSSGSNTTWVLTFTESGYLGASLPDGAYELIVSAGGVTSGVGLNMSTTQDFTFWRMYGDFEGNGAVNGDDFTTLISVLGTQTNAGNWYLDYNGDGVIDGDDFTAFVTRLGDSMTIPSLPSVELLSAASPATTTSATANHTNAVIATPSVTSMSKPVAKRKPRHGHG